MECECDTMPEMSFVCDRLDPGTITVIQGVGFLDLEIRFVSIMTCKHSPDICRI
jgi:hypothetical protein